ncbi:MAG: bi-domain-containing oxidoreductase [Bacteroidales bacterium]|nr:bi-domain-containing oxidoreductase [Bacteroidales bacterium]
MKQAIVRKGLVIGEEVPAPVVSEGSVLIKVVNSCISAGTEMSGIISSGTPLIKRILKQPEKVAKILNLARTEGISRVYQKVKGELDTGKPTGYSISGVVIGVGKGAEKFKIGDRVAAAGGGLANHAEYVDVPVNLVVKIPNDLGFKEASTVTLGAIALHGARRVDLRLGEFCVVFGTGILGLLTIQILNTSGIRVIAIDLDNKRLTLAQKYGAERVIDPQQEDPVKIVENITNGLGADAVIFTAATSSSKPLSQSFNMCRRKGKVVLVGVSGMEIDRKDIYSKEIDFLISTSYGPGRYDKSYEEKGIDYPYAYVRWTENRNLSEYLRLLKTGSLNIKAIIQKVFSIDQVTAAFNSLKQTEDKPLMVLLDYGFPEANLLDQYRDHKRKIEIRSSFVDKDVINVALVGAGSFATNVHLPNLKNLSRQYKIYAISDKNGHTAKAIAEQYQANYATTNVEEILNDQNVDLVLICTRHNSHAEITLKALEKGKHVFVEKPLATSHDELKKIEDFFNNHPIENKPVLMVGFNRRFSKYSVEIKKHTDRRINTLFIHYRMNAGYIQQDHWVHENGGRIVGEACHIIDLMSFFTQSPIASVNFESLSPATGHFNSSDNKSFILKYEDGSVATIEYFSVGNREFPKEYMEVHFDEKTIVLDNYKTLIGYGIKIKELHSSVSEKGHLEEWLELYESLKGSKTDWPIPLEELIQTTQVTFLIK